MKLDSSIIQAGSATYSPEDNKLRLYVGRVPRPEYDALRAEGWTATPKQSCQFVAHWTPQRRDTALAYGNGLIEDEDQSPAERAADRAERFGEYRDKRTAEAVGHADRYDSQPSAHGFQSEAKAERAAARHDRIADHACDAWSKAEYWQRRTKGVIAHALYVSAPHVRMGRIKELEADLRRMEQTPDSYPNWIPHVRLRLEYERQMLAAQGGRAGELEIEVGGLWGSKVIAKVNKSNATGRVVTVAVIGPRVEGWTYQVANEPGTQFALYAFDAERAAPGTYSPPTDASRAKLAEFLAAKKAAQAERKAKTPPCPLINPTEADAERLQALWNERAKVKHCTAMIRQYGRDYADQFEPAKVLRITQATYSANSSGSYAKAKTEPVGRGGEQQGRHYDYKRIEAVCQIRTTWQSGNCSSTPRRVIILTDKPQKPLPAAVWEPLPVAVEVNA